MKQHVVYDAPDAGEAKARLMRLLRPLLSAEDLRHVESILDGEGPAGMAEDAMLPPLTRDERMAFDSVPSQHRGQAIRAFREAKADRSRRRSEAGKGFAERYPDAARIKLL